MFEIIGVFVSLLLLLAISAIIGVIYAAIAYLILRTRPQDRKKKIRRAASLPLRFAFYLLACVIVFNIFVSGQPDPFFGDIAEPLPNGYVLKALGKMPQYATIQSTTNPFKNITSRHISSLAVTGPFVLGAYSWRFDQAWDDSPDANHGYFVLDTRNANLSDFNTLRQLTQFVGHPVYLTKTALFRSQDSQFTRVRPLEILIAFGPPVIISVLFFFSLYRQAHPVSA